MTQTLAEIMLEYSGSIFYFGRDRAQESIICTGAEMARESMKVFGRDSNIANFDPESYRKAYDMPYGAIPCEWRDADLFCTEFNRKFVARLVILAGSRGDRVLAEALAEPGYGWSEMVTNDGYPIASFARDVPGPRLFRSLREKSEVHGVLKTFLLQRVQITDGRVEVVHPTTGRRHCIFMRKKLKSIDDIPGSWRSDAPAIRHLAKDYSEDAAKLWARPALPLIDLRQEWPRIVPVQTQLENEIPSLALRPFRHCVLDCGLVAVQRMQGAAHEVPLGLTRPRDEVEYFARLWSLVIDQQEVRHYEKLFQAIGCPMEQFSMMDNSVFLVILAYDTFEERWFPPMVIESPEEQWTETHPRFNGTSKYIAAVGTGLGRAILTALAYLCAPPEQLVEVSPAPLLRPMKEKDTKPWTRSKASIRIMDPRTVKRRHDSIATGTHATPVHHHRRGGFKTLLHPRFYRNWGEILDLSGLDAPLPLKDVEYDEERFFSGIDHQLKPHVFRKDGRRWYELEVRRIHFREAYVGDREFADLNGVVYRVLEEENDLELLAQRAREKRKQ